MIGLLGFGAIARELVASFEMETVNWTALVRNGAETTAQGVRFVSSLSELLASRPDAVVEVAGADAVRVHVPALLEAGIPVVLASVGALSEEALSERLRQARERSGTPLVIPSGAVGGLDYVTAVARLPGAAVLYTSRKPVAAWTDELAARGLDAREREVLLFEGTPADAARLYPKNLNAAFTIAQAAWPAPVSVHVVADPLAAGNTHEIEVTSAAGAAFMRFVNAPSRNNPKSSMVTALSLAAALRTLLEQDRRG